MKKKIKETQSKAPAKAIRKTAPKRQPKEDFNQAAFRAVQETIRLSGETK